MSGVRVVCLDTDHFSPMSAPHGLAALLWPGLAKETLLDGGVEKVEDRLRRGHWEPQWRFTMYKQAHYHSTTHELLTVVQGSASIQLGGTDERARPRNRQGQDARLDLTVGDVLLLPAGYSHRSLETHGGFTMVGAYPSGAERWDMRFPNINGCVYDCEKITRLIESTRRKGLLDAQGPDALFLTMNTADKDDDLATLWRL